MRHLWPVLLLLWLGTPAQAAQCKVDGKWYPYDHPYCGGPSEPEAPPAPQVIYVPVPVPAGTPNALAPYPPASTLPPDEPPRETAPPAPPAKSYYERMADEYDRETARRKAAREQADAASKSRRAEQDKQDRQCETLKEEARRYRNLARGGCEPSECRYYDGKYAEAQRKADLACQ